MGVASLSLDSKPGSSQMGRHRHATHQMTPGGGGSSSATNTTPSGLPPYLQNHRYASLMQDSPDAAAMSPGLSSVATSTSGDIEVSGVHLIKGLMIFWMAGESKHFVWKTKDLYYKMRLVTLKGLQSDCRVFFRPKPQSDPRLDHVSSYRLMYALTASLVGAQAENGGWEGCMLLSQVLCAKIRAAGLRAVD